jgi:hypothetical protein
VALGQVRWGSEKRLKITLVLGKGSGCAAPFNDTSLNPIEISMMGRPPSLVQRLSKHNVTAATMRYPPELSEEQAESLISDIKDWQLIHGSVLKLVKTEEEHIVFSHPIGVAVFPTLFPRGLYYEALELQTIYNKLYTAVAEDEHWLYQTLQGLIEVDALTKVLWEIYEEVRREGYVQDLSLGVWRNDYMLHGTDGPVLKQVEFNTIAVAGGTHGNKTSDKHQYLQKIGAYQSSCEEQIRSVQANTVNRPPRREDQSPPYPEITISSMPPNHTIRNITAGLVASHQAYGPPKSTTQKCVLFIVQPRNFNIADERPLEHALWDQTPPVPAHRLEFGANVLEHTTLTPSRELLYHPPSRPGLTLEVSVVYFRSAFETHEYNNIGRMARLHLERSRAIKCPNILGHLCTFKKVQQGLTMPGVLEKFLTFEEAERVRQTFASIYVLDRSEQGIEARKLALDSKSSRNYVLQPSLEGGGHNVYGSAIPAFLKSVKEELWETYVLQAKIVPPTVQNVLISQRGMFEGDVISELGVFGICLWRRNSGDKGQGRLTSYRIVTSLGEGILLSLELSRQLKAYRQLQEFVMLIPSLVTVKMVKEQEPSWSFKTKDANVDEMSVVKGYGCFDSPLLVEEEVFRTCVGGR